MTGFWGEGKAKTTAHTQPWWLWRALSLFLKWTQYLKSRTKPSFEKQRNMIYIKIKAMNTWGKDLGKILKGKNAYPFLRKIKCHILKEGEPGDLIEGREGGNERHHEYLPPWAASYLPQNISLSSPFAAPFHWNCLFTEAKIMRTSTPRSFASWAVRYGSSSQPLDLDTKSPTLTSVDPVGWCRVSQSSSSSKGQPTIAWTYPQLIVYIRVHSVHCAISQVNSMSAPRCPPNGKVT